MAYKVKFEDGTTVSINTQEPPTQEQVAAVWNDLQAKSKPVDKTTDKIAFGLQEAAGAAAPTAAGLAAFPAGAAAGAALGPVGSIVGGLAASVAASSAAQLAQDAVLKGTMGDEQFGKMMQDIQENREKYPVTSFAAQLAPQALAFKPNLKNVGEAIKTAKEMTKGADAFKKFVADPKNANAVANLSNVAVSTAVPGAITTVQELTDDKEGINMVRVAGDMVAGAVLNDPTKVGKAIMGIKDAPIANPVQDVNIPRTDDAFLTIEAKKLAATAKGEDFKFTDADLQALSVGSKMAKTKESQTAERLAKAGILSPEERIAHAKELSYEPQPDAEVLKKALDFRNKEVEEMIRIADERFASGAELSAEERVGFNMLRNDIYNSNISYNHPIRRKVSEIIARAGSGTARSLRAGRLGMSELVRSLDEQSLLYKQWRSEMVAKDPKLEAKLEKEIPVEKALALKKLAELKDNIKAKEYTIDKVRGTFSADKELALKRIDELTEKHLQPYKKLVKDNIDAYLEAHYNGDLANADRYSKAVSKNLALYDAPARNDWSNLEDVFHKAFYGRETKDVRLGIETAIRGAMQDVIPTDMLAQVRSAQTMAMLLNLKTPAGNYIGNTVFSLLREATAPISYLVDKTVSFVTKGRTVAGWKPGAIIKGAKGITGIEFARVQQGLERVFQQNEFKFANAKKIAKDITIDVLRNSTRAKYDPDEVDGYIRRSFGKGFMRKAEDAMTLLLGVPDSAAGRAAMDAALGNEMRLVRDGFKDSVDMGAVQMAKMRAIYADDNIVSKQLVELRKFLNKRTGNENFGLGDLIIKFPGVPGSILAKGLDYSPVGFIRSLYEVVAPNFTGKQFNQAEFVRSFSEALVGTLGAVGAGYMMNALGVITTKYSDDPDIAAVQKAQGWKESSINVSALYRALLTGDFHSKQEWETGDMIVPYGFAQPLALPLTMGALAFDKLQGTDNSSLSGFQKLAAIMVGSGAAAESTISNERLFSGITDVFKAGTYEQQGGGNFLWGMAKAPILSSGGTFVPTLLRQMNDIMDNQQRAIDYGQPEEFWQRIASSTPWLSSSLPKAYDVLGNEQEKWIGGSNDFLKVLLSPSAIVNLRETDAGNEVLRLFDATGEGKQAPTKVPRKLDITRNGQKQRIELTAGERAELQKIVGQLTVAQFNQELMSEGWEEKPDSYKVKVMAGIVSDTMAAVKIAKYGHQTSKRSARVAKLARLLQGED